MSGVRTHSPLRQPALRTLAVWAALLCLVALTVGTAYIPLGAANMAINILVAIAKAGLIAAFFMHLAGPHPVLRLVGIVAVAMLVVMFALSGVDYATRDGGPRHATSASQ